MNLIDDLPEPSPEIIADLLRELRARMHVGDMIPKPRTVEDLIRAGDLDTCQLRELVDIASELGLDVPDRRPMLLREIKVEAVRRGWMK